MTRVEGELISGNRQRAGADRDLPGVDITRLSPGRAVLPGWCRARQRLPHARRVNPQVIVVVAYKAAHTSAARFTDLHLSDLEQRNSDAATQRIKALGGAASKYFGPADKVVDDVIDGINPYGLHLAFLDPFGLGQLPFSIIERMLKIRRMDMIVHVSLSDLQRNLDDYSRVRDPTLDNFAPGWRDAIDVRQAIAPLRAALIEYWLALIRSLGSHPATGIPLIVGEQNQRLYWLVFLSSDPLGHKLWNDVQNLTGQRTLL
jgi:three-Cys-motif partner protein